MVLVDTSVWIDYFLGKNTGQTLTLDSLFDSERICTGDLIIAEIMQGIKTKNEIATANHIISLLEYYDLVGRDIAFKAAENYRYLRKKGVTIRKTIDVIIGTFCIENQIKLLHNDRDFDPFVKFLGLEIL